VCRQLHERRHCAPRLMLTAQISACSAKQRRPAMGKHVVYGA
jgi:hypothetical protein